MLRGNFQIKERNKEKAKQQKTKKKTFDSSSSHERQQQNCVENLEIGRNV